MASRLNWRLIVRAGITLSILGYFGFKLEWAEMGRQLARSDPYWLLAACLLFGTSLVLGSARWWILLRIQKIVLPFSTVAALVFIGQFFNSFLLGSVGGDVIKAVYVLKYAPQQKAHAALSILTDRAMGLFGLLCFVLASLPWQLSVLQRYTETRIIIDTLVILFAISVLAIAGLMLLPFQRLPNLFHRLWLKVPRRHTLASLLTGFRQHGQSPLLILEAVACTVLVDLIIFVASYCIAKAIQIDMTFIQALVIVSIVICVISLPISVGGHGIREGAFILLFAVFGITTNSQTGTGQEPAALFSLLFFGLFAVWCLVGGWVYLAYKHSFGGGALR